MKIVQATLWIYLNAIRRSGQSVAKNWIVSFAPLIYGVGLSVAAWLAAPLGGIVGGFLLGLASQACLSSGLYLIQNIVQIGKTNFDDFVKGFTVYFWELVRIAFILWIPLWVASQALASVPNGRLIFALIQIALYVFLNPVPEFIYQTRSSGVELLSASYTFIVENWIEWFIPNIALTAAGYLLLQLLEISAAGLPGFLQVFLVAFVFGLCLTYVMVFRGFLFAELNGTNRRSRVYRYNAS
ncbi:MAG TPA: hypothetical protein VFU31_12380 [Candidatus Binatia bacterium]|nr:hypothetical protein [Candidatus Binatia bacterium]